MNQPSKIVAAAALAGFSLVVAGFAAAPHGAGAAASTSITAAARIDGAFGISPQRLNPAAVAAVKRSRKGDLLVNAGCAGQYWPHIEPGCLVLGDDGRNPAVRTVTVGYQVSETGSVLIRMPAPQIASR